MNTSIFVLKVLLLSIAISLAIKYAAPLVTIAPTTPIVVTAILLPSVIILVLLISLQQPSNPNDV